MKSVVAFLALAGVRAKLADQILEAARGELLEACFARSWIVLSEFDYADPARDILNVAYPSSIASYFVTLVPKNSRYVFEGTFPSGEGVYQVNLIAYDENGNADPSIPPIFDRGSNGKVSMDVATNDSIKFVLQRYYLDPEIFSDADLEANLFNVTKIEEFTSAAVPPLSTTLRTILSRFLEGFIQDIIAASSATVTSAEPTQFALPGDTSSLFSDPSHVYLFSIVGSGQVATITGTFNITGVRPFFDFIAVNQNTTATEDALPFYDFIQPDGSYVLTAASASYTGPVSNNTIRWADDNEFPLILVRIITYDYDAINYTGPLDPAQTSALIPDIYPTITYDN